MAKRWRYLVLLFLLPGLPTPASAGQAGLKPFEKDGQWGYQNASGRTAIHPRFVIAQEFSPQGIAPVVDEHGWAYIDVKGQVVIRPFVIDNGPDYFREGLARFTVDGRFGFFDKSGKVVIKPQFDFAAPFYEALAAICAGCKEEIAGEHRAFRGGEWGFINHQGAIVIAPQFEAAERFQKGKARVKIRGQWRYIDKQGRLMGKRSIGSARMEEDGTIVLLLRAEGPGVSLGDGLLRYPPNHAEYQKIPHHLGGLKKGESKPVPPWPGE